MGMIKVKKWELLLITRLGIPILKKISYWVTKKAEEDTEENWLDGIAAALSIVIEFLEDPEVFYA